MKTRRRLLNVVSKPLARTLLLFVTLISALPVHAQIVTPLIQFTNVWKYDRSGLELGTAWRTNDFDDSAWDSGRGLLGYDDIPSPYLLHVPTGFGTQFPSPLSQVTTTYYFRTTFQFTGTTNFVQLFATNLVDDGCAIWLNGRLAGGVRMPANFIANTFFTGPSVEGQLDVVSLTNFLRQGANQLAVEVHQLASTSADVAFGMRLMSFTPTPLAITNQPQNLMVTIGNPVAFQVGVSGGPVTCRWYKDGTVLPSTSNSLNIANAQLANTGNYFATCSNALGVVTSAVARLNVVADLDGPKVLAAIADNGFGFHTVHVRFSEPLILGSATSPISARNPTNYLVTRLGTTNTLKATNILYSSAQGTLLQVDTTDTNWVRFGDYVLTINNVADLRTNSIAPHTQVPILWNHNTNLIEASHEWEFHNSSVFDPDVFDENWTACDYQPGPWWGQGYAPFYGVFSPNSPCPTLGEPLTPLGWQPEPMLFRTTFTYPAHWPAAATLRLRLSVDDGLVLYLNGLEIYRYNAADPAGTPVGIGSRAFTALNIQTCITNIAVAVTNLLPGTNCFAVAVLQPSATDSDLYFVMSADAIVPLGPELPASPPPALQATPANTDTLRLSWDTGGYILESSTNLTSGPLSYPYGPWTPVPQLANPYHWPLTNGETTFFRLRK